MRPAVFLDRDGILNKVIVRNGQKGSPRTVEEFELLPGVASAVAMLRRAGLLVVVVTNQPDVARGFLTAAELERIHECLRSLVSVDAIYACAHDDNDECMCRKPKPGLLLQAAEELNIAITISYLVGDSWKDIQAGRKAGCKTFLVKTADNISTDSDADFVVSNLWAAVDMIAAKHARELEN